MFLYTIVPAQMIMQNESETRQADEAVPCRYGFVSGRRGPEGLSISRLISTDLAAYLDDSFSPGRIFRTCIHK